MAFNTLVEDTRRMNAKMIAMGQSIDIQKMPRPKAGSQIAQKQAMYTPSGSDVEKMLYPKNFRPRVFEPETTQSNSEIIDSKEKKNEEANKTQELVEEVMTEQKPIKEKIIDGEKNDGIIITPKTEQEPINTGKTIWERCKHYKKQGNRAFCKEYLGWCAEGKCARPKL